MLSASAAYDTWDANDDTYLNREEFYDGYFNLLDRNNSGTIEAAEWHHQKLPDNQRTEQLTENFAAWDADDNDLIGPAELQKPLQKVAYFSYLDEDDNDRLNHTETSSAIFHLLDHNDNGHAEREDYDIWLETELDNEEAIPSSEQTDN